MCATAPYFGVRLQAQGWRPDEIGFVMTAGGLAGLVCTTPLGALADHTNRKRLLLAVSVIVTIVACAIIFFWQGVVSATLSKAFSCAAAGAIAPVLTGITLGMTGQEGFAARLGVNEAWSHAGNTATDLLGGIAGWYAGIPGVFAVMAVMGPLPPGLANIDPAAIDYSRARGLGANRGGAPAPPKSSPCCSPTGRSSSGA